MGVDLDEALLSQKAIGTIFQKAFVPLLDFFFGDCKRKKHETSLELSSSEIDVEELQQYVLTICFRGQFVQRVLLQFGVVLAHLVLMMIAMRSAMATSRQETIISIKLAILPARMLHATSCHTPMSALTTSSTVLQQPQDESPLLLLLTGKAVAIYAFVSFSR